MRKLMKKYNIQLNLILVLGAVLLVLVSVFYFLLPEMLNYPAGTVGTSFQHELEGTDYTMQVLLIGIALFFIYIGIVFVKTRFLVNIDYKVKHVSEMSDAELGTLKAKLFSVPYNMYILNIFLPVVAITVIHAVTTMSFDTKLLKIMLLLFSFITVSSTICLIFTRSIFTRILDKLPEREGIKYKKLKLTSRIAFHILPLFVVGIVFTSLLAYSRLTREKSDITFNAYRDKLSHTIQTSHITSVDDLFAVSRSMETINKGDKVFIYTERQGYMDEHGNQTQYSKFFTKYLKELSISNQGRVYEYYGTDAQAATYRVNINGEEYVVGIYYMIVSSALIIFFVVTFVILLTLNIVVLTLFSDTISTDIKRISDGMLNLIKEKNVDLNSKLPVTSNDEIGELTIAFNKVQDLTKQNIEQIKNNQDVLVEKERLASLGQLIGGIAHNLKTPIMSIAGASQGVLDLTDEYRRSVDSPQVTPEDHKEIANEIDGWIEKIKVHTSYMSDVITAVKGQAVALSNTADVSFTIEDLVKHVDILMKHELKNALIYLNVDLKVDKNTKIKGNINSLVQVINNMVSNSIQAYNGQTGKNIDFRIYNEKDKLVIAIQDYASGMPKFVKDKLLKEMITTKGKNGSGLGIYMSAANIKAHFGGKLSFESEEGKGTTFYIILPFNRTDEIKE